jgi:ABC-2 type transport system permease protein
MNKTLQIALREFLATVATKGFLIGILMLPLMLGLVLLLIPWLVKQQAPLAVEGEVLVFDPAGDIAPLLRDYLSPEASSERRRKPERRLEDMMPRGMRGGAADAALAGDPLRQVLGAELKLRIVELPEGTDIPQLRRRMSVPDSGAGNPLALILIGDPALQAPGRSGDGAQPFEILVPQRSDERLLDELRSAVRHALVEAELIRRGLDPVEIRRLTQAPPVAIHRLDASGERSTNEIASRILPLAFMMLVMIAVLTAGQHLMTSTIEEKSSRVIEVLLAAVSPMQLMAGKILGQGAVALLMLGVYSGLGLLALLSLAAIGLVQPIQVLYLLLFFLIAFLTIAALMAAIGAAVNELREAQTLLTPVMLILVLPMMLWLPISRDPNGSLATVLSLTPGIGPLIMVMRTSSSNPPPEWQIALAVLIGIAGVFAAIWLAGKVFRVGLLMHGKPPNLATLWRWIRMA